MDEITQDAVGGRPPLAVEIEMVRAHLGPGPERPRTEHAEAHATLGRRISKAQTPMAQPNQRKYTGKRISAVNTAKASHAHRGTSRGSQWGIGDFNTPPGPAPTPHRTDDNGFRAAIATVRPRCGTWGTSSGPPSGCAGAAPGSAWAGPATGGVASRRCSRARAPSDCS